MLEKTKELLDILHLGRDPSRGTVEEARREVYELIGESLELYDIQHTLATLLLNYNVEDLEDGPPEYCRDCQHVIIDKQNIVCDNIFGLSVMIGETKETCKPPTNCRYVRYRELKERIAQLEAPTKVQKADDGVNLHNME